MLVCCFQATGLESDILDGNTTINETIMDMIQYCQNNFGKGEVGTIFAFTIR